MNRHNNWIDTALLLSILTLLALVVPLAGCASSPRGHWPDAPVSRAEKFHLLCLTADLMTTYKDMEDGAIEANPLLSGLDPAGVLAVSGGIGLTLHLTPGARHQPKKVWWSLGAVRCGAAAWNLSVIAGGE